LNLEATSDDHLEPSRVISNKNVRLLRTVVIFGPNASGKSNLLKAMRVMRNFVLSSGREGQIEDKIPAEPFRLLDDADEVPSSFELEFILGELRYRYGFSADTTRIHSEWLFRKRPKTRAATLFTREGQIITPNPDHFKEGVERKQFARPNALFLSVCAQLNGQLSVEILAWFERFVFASGFSDASYLKFTAKYLRDPSNAAEITRFAQRADLSICGLSSEWEEKPEDTLPKSLPQETRRKLISTGFLVDAAITIQHARFSKHGEPTGTVEFDLEKDESQGTRKFIALAGPLFDTVRSGNVLVIDEFEARLHPLLTQQIFEWFHSAARGTSAQLVIASQDPLLLDPEHVRRDQVWFCEKDQQGATNLYSLAEFDPQQVRHTTKFGRQYLLGIFGAVPHLALSPGESIDAKAEAVDPEKRS
jgi:hypothetical protein